MVLRCQDASCGTCTNNEHTLYILATKVHVANKSTNTLKLLVLLKDRLTALNCSWLILFFFALGQLSNMEVLHQLTLGADISSAIRVVLTSKPAGARQP